MIGVIGGSGLYELPGFVIKERKVLKTPYGKPSEEYLIGELYGRSLAFLSRHSLKHKIPPHKVNYRANIKGFQEIGVERVIAINAVGGISKDLKPGFIVLPDQIIDFTKKRINTFFDADEVVHVDFTEPFCNELREAFLNAARVGDNKIVDKGTYICVEGPRLETASEIHFFSMIGANVVGMTMMPEAVLARELEMCYASLAVVTNYAAGISAKRLTTREVLETMDRSTNRIKSLLSEVIKLIPEERRCPCKDAIGDARI